MTTHQLLAKCTSKHHGKGNNLPKQKCSTLEQNYNSKCMHNKPIKGPMGPSRLHLHTTKNYSHALPKVYLNRDCLRIPLYCSQLPYTTPKCT